MVFVKVCTKGVGILKFAVIGDIHSNIYALESVLKDIDKRNVDFIVSTGDLVGYLPFPNEVISCIKEKGILAIQGNHDKRIAESLPISQKDIENMTPLELTGSASGVFTNMTISDEHRNYLGSMPQYVSLESGGLRIKMVHGSPNSINEYLYEDSEAVRQLAKEMQEDVIISGHTHLPYHQVINKKHFINAGSVGKPKHGNANAIYVIVEVKEQEVFTEFVEVVYEVEKVLEVIAKSQYFDHKLMDMLRKGY
jgi:putative phosphoesterase